MTEHLLPEGKRLIAALSDLGRLLGYHVEQEFPVDSVGRGTPPAVDVAWFSDRDQSFPLMIFEVETSAGSSMANNPLKVFAQRNTRFEKPLFYFHVVAAKGRDSSRIDNLAAQYGAHNYRIYRIGLDEGTKLGLDTLSQHRRISSEVDRVGLYELFARDDYQGIADPLDLVRHADKLGLSSGTRLSSYVRLSRRHPRLLSELLAVAHELLDDGAAGAEGFDTHLGQSWWPLLVCAIGCARGRDEDERDSWAAAMLSWQRRGGSLPMITPAFGLSRDYDEFLLGLAGPLVALVLGITSGRVDLRTEFADVLIKILSKVEPGWEGLQAAIWTCHVAARFAMEDEFGIARDYIDATGRVSSERLMRPPSAVYGFDCVEAGVFEKGDGSACPDLEDFRQLALVAHASVVDPIQVALRALDDDNFLFEWSDGILGVLWRSANDVQ